jgi:uncharacterized FlgJ-related protein
MFKLYTYCNKSVKFVPLTITNYIKFVLFIGFIFSSLSFTASFKFNNFIEKIPVIIRPNEQKFSKEWLKETLISLNAEHVDILLAQSEIETGNYTSNIFKLNKNLFGMKCAQSRISTHKGEQFGHAKYNSYYESVLDICFWQANYARNLSKEEYLQLLHEIYAENKEYVTLIKQKL